MDHIRQARRVHTAARLSSPSAGGRSADEEPARDREGLERLVRYVARPPLANEQLEETNDGRIALRLPKPRKYGVIQRFSEDLDLMVQHGAVSGLPAVTNWTSVNKGPVASRRAFYEALPGAFVIPAVKIEIDEKAQDRLRARHHLVGRYPGVLLDQLSPTMSPYVFFEIGRARVVPFVEKPLTSFVHDWLERRDQLRGYTDNRPRTVRCIRW